MSANSGGSFGKNSSQDYVSLSSTEVHNVESFVSLQAPPNVGMEFKTAEEAKAYYQEYGRKNGFWICIRTSGKSRSRIDEVTFMKFVCSHEGKNKTNVPKSSEVDVTKKVRSSSTVKGGCNAYMRILNDFGSGHWVVKAFEDVHNHKLLSPLKPLKMRSNRNTMQPSKDLTEVFREESVQVNRFTSILGTSLNDGNYESTKVLRFSHMCRKATQVACYAVESGEGYCLFMKTLEEVSTRIYKMDKKWQRDWKMKEKVKKAIGQECLNLVLNWNRINKKSKLPQNMMTIK